MALSDYPRPEDLETCAAEEQFMGAGQNNRAYALSDDTTVLRVSKHYRKLWNTDNPPTLHIIPQPLAIPNAGIGLAEYHALDPETEKMVVVADIQRRVRGELMGLTAAEQQARYKKVSRVRDVDEVADNGAIVMKLPAGSVDMMHVPEPEAIAESNGRLLNVAQAIVDMPDSFFTQLLCDVRNIERAGYKLDPSKGQNFYLILEQQRLGFVDLMPGDGRCLSPDEIATVLRQPANQTWFTDQTDDEKARVRDLSDRTTARVIRACDQLGLEFCADKSHIPNLTSGAKEFERGIRERFGEEYGIARPSASVRPIMLDKTGRPLGHAPA